MAFNVDLSATPAIINAGDSFVLAWDIRGGVGPLTVTIDNGVGDGGGGSGSKTITLSTATTYIVTVTDLLGNVVTSQINVLVRIIPPPASLIIDVSAAYDQPFDSGYNYPPDIYTVTYSAGAMRYNSALAQWFRPTITITDHAGNDVVWTGSTAYGSSAACIAAEVGSTKSYAHVGGLISVTFTDSFYPDNDETTPGPTYGLNGLPVVPVYPITGNLVADDVTIYAGSVTTLRWASTNATAATVNGSGVSTTGTLAVSPTTTTDYTLSFTAPNCTTVNRTVTVNVLPLPAPGNVSAVDSCGSSILISWAAVGPATAYKVFRATSSGGAYAQIGPDVIGTSLLDTPMGGAPLPWVPYFYRVQSVCNGQVSANSAEVTATASTTLAQATGLTLSAGPGTIIASWVAVAHASTYNLYRNGILAGSTPGLALVDAVTSDQAYTYTVAGVGPCGVGPQSAPSTVTALPAAKASTNTTVAASTASNVPAPTSTSTNSGTPAGAWTNAPKLPNNWK